MATRSRWVDDLEKSDNIVMLALSFIMYPLQHRRRFRQMQKTR